MTKIKYVLNEYRNNCLIQDRETSEEIYKWLKSKNEPLRTCLEIYDVSPVENRRKLRVYYWTSFVRSISFGLEGQRRSRLWLGSRSAPVPHLIVTDLSCVNRKLRLLNNSNGSVFLWKLARERGRLPSSGGSSCRHP